MSEYPYLTINSEPQLEWVMGFNGETKSVQVTRILNKKTIGTLSNETVNKFIRYSRNFYAIWTNYANTYEYGPDGLTKIKLKTIVPPTYSNGWYIGYTKNQPSNHITFVNRLYPELCIGVNFTGKDIKSLHRMPWTNHLIVNTEKGAYRFLIDMDKESSDGVSNPELLERTKLAASFDLFAMDSEGAVIALNHVDGKTSIIWTSSWKTHHTLRSPKLIQMKVNKKHMVGINQNKHIYLWDLISGDVETVVNSQWHSPEYLFFCDTHNDDDIVTIDPTNRVLAVWTLGKDTEDHVTWPTYRISPSVRLLATVAVQFSISAACYWNNKIILNADGFIIKIDTNLCGDIFTWPEKIITWIDNPMDEIYLEPLMDKDDSLWPVVKRNLINNMYIIVNNIIEHVSAGEKSHPWCFQRILKDGQIKESFYKTFIGVIKTLYQENLFDDTQASLNMGIYIRTMNIEIESLYEELANPITKSDFIFWTYIVKSLNLKNEAAIAEKDGFIEAIWTVYDLTDDPEIKLCAKNLMFLLRPYIKCWGLILKDRRVFEFVTNREVKRSCVEGWANAWLDIFIEYREYSLYNENIQQCWKELVSYLLHRDILRSFIYPNVNDGKWILKPIDEINKTDWVLIDELVRIFDNKIPAGTEDKSILTWMRNKSGRKHSIERALALLDTDLWTTNSDWRENICQLVNLEKGWEVHVVGSNTKGIVYKWPTICCSRTNKFIELDSETTVRYRIPKMKYNIPVKLLIDTEYYIKSLILSEKLPEIPDSYKSVLFDSLRPMPIQTLQSIDIMVEVTCMVADRGDGLWIGTHSGIVCFILLSELACKHDDRHVVEIISGHVGPINSIDCKRGKIVSADDSGCIKIWDCVTHICQVTVQMDLLSVKAVRFVDNSSIWILSSNGELWSYNFLTCAEPEIITSLKNNESILNHYSMDIMDNYCIAVSKRLTHWFCDYPYTLNKIDRCEDRISVVKNLTTSEYIYGTMCGKVVLGSVDDTIPHNETIWQAERDSITALNVIQDGANLVVIIGCESGKLLFKYIDEPDRPIIFEWRASNSITSIVYHEPRIIIACSDYSMYTLIYRTKQIQHASECLVKLSKQKDWQRFIRRRPEAVQRIIIHGVQNSFCLHGFSDVISLCIDDFNGRARWCTKTVKNILMIGSHFKPKLFEPLIDKLFCFSGKKFTCTLCLGSSSSPKRFPVSLLSTCLHRFHTKCIEKHVEKSREWHDECQQNWALQVKLACPTCREPFNRSHIMTDTFTAEICKYESSSSDEET